MAKAITNYYKELETIIKNKKTKKISIGKHNENIVKQKNNGKSYNIIIIDDIDTFNTK